MVPFLDTCYESLILRTCSDVHVKPENSTCQLHNLTIYMSHCGWPYLPSHTPLPHPYIGSNIDELSKINVFLTAKSFTFPETECRCPPRRCPKIGKMMSYAPTPRPVDGLKLVDAQVQSPPDLAVSQDTSISKKRKVSV
jgi:hypothetical protein